MDLLIVDSAKHLEDDKVFLKFNAGYEVIVDLVE